MIPAGSTLGLAALVLTALVLSPSIARRSAWPQPLIQLLLGMSLAAVWVVLPDSIGEYALSLHPGDVWVGRLQTVLGSLVVFLAGRGLPFDHLRRRWRPLLGYSAAKFVPAMLLLPPLCVLLWPGSLMGALVIGIALCEISVAVSWSMLSAHGRLESEHGRDLLATTFLVNSAVIVCVLLLLREISVLSAAAAFLVGILSRGRTGLSEAALSRWKSSAMSVVVPLFFVLAGARVEWSAILQSLVWIPLLGAALLVRIPIRRFSASSLLGCDASEGGYCDVLSAGRLTFAVLILGLGLSDGVLTAEMMSAAMVVIASLAAISAFRAHRSQLSRDSAPVS